MPSFMNPDYENLPKHVQELVDGMPSENEPLCCIQCRGAFSGKPQRCTRCTVAHYCSKECQRKHFCLHKSNCKRIGTNTQRLVSIQSEEDASTIMLDLADTLVVMGYRESDTVLNGAFYYRRALQYFMKAYKILQDRFFYNLRLEDKALLLMVVLGAEHKVLMEWCMYSGSQRSINFGPPLVYAPPQFQTHGLADNDCNYQSLCLLHSMRSLSQYRRDLAAFESFVILAEEHIHPDILRSHVLPFLVGNMKDGRLHMDVLPDSIRLIVEAIRHHGNGESLEHLRDTHPFSPQHAPSLIYHSLAPPEYWYLYQYCFFLTPGLYDVLVEFVPEDE